MNAELVRIVDAISRDKNIDKEMVFTDLETAMVSAARKAFGQFDDVQVQIDRLSGDIIAFRNGVQIDLKDLGRIPAQTAKQVMIQKLREAERGSIFEEFSERKGQIIAGTVARFEGGAMVVNLGRAEGFLPRSEQIPGEAHQPGDRIRTMILDVREAPHQVKIVLTRSHPDFIRRLFELEVPEVAERIIETKALAREAGYRTKIAVSSIDSRVDAVGACVGVRGSRIKNIVDELGGEKIDIVRWNESSQILITNALKPAEIQETALCFELGRATVVVAEDQLSLAIGKRGQNVRLAARLTGWDVDILTPAEYNKGLDDLEKTLKGIEGVEDVMIDKLMAMGIISLADLEEVGTEPLVNELGMTAELAATTVEVAAEEAKRIAAEMQAAKEAAEREKAEAEAAEAASAEVDDTAAATAESGEEAAVGAEDSSEKAAGETAPPEGEAAPAAIDALAVDVGQPAASTDEGGEQASGSEPDAAAEPAVTAPSETDVPAEVPASAGTVAAADSDDSVTNEQSPEASETNEGQ